MFFNLTHAMLPDELQLNNDLFFKEVARMLSQGHSVTLRAKGNSMLPFIADGRDCVVLLKSDNLSPGDIVLADVPGKGYLLHRIYLMQGEWITLMGDGNLYATEQCRQTDVLGKVMKIVRNGQYVDCNSPYERFKSFCWKRLLPLRRYLLFILRRFV